MTPAVFILCGLWCGRSPVHGAHTLAPGRGALHVGGGVNVVLPVLRLGATLGLAPRVDASLTYETHGGLAHVVTAGARVRLAERWALTTAVAHGLFVVEEIGGIQSARAPFGNGLTTTHALTFSRWNPSGLHVALAAGVTVRWLAPRASFDVVTLAPDVTLHTAHLDVTVEWAARSPGTWWLQVRALVPVQADFHLLGYLPMITVGRSWSLE